MIPNSLKRQPLGLSKRFISYSRTSHGLFGGGGFAKPPKMEPPSGKSEASTNPADIFKKNDILMYSQKPLNYVESVKPDGFHLANSLYIKSPDSKGNIIGTMLLENETFEINLSSDGFSIINGFIIEFNEKQILQIFEKLHPKPEILVVGLGKQARRLSDSNRKYLAKLGIQLEVGDSKHSGQIYDLLATERPNTIAALLLPPNV